MEKQKLQPEPPAREDGKQQLFRAVAFAIVLLALAVAFAITQFALSGAGKTDVVAPTVESGSCGWEFETDKVANGEVLKLTYEQVEPSELIFYCDDGVWWLQNTWDPVFEPPRMRVRMMARTPVSWCMNMPESVIYGTGRMVSIMRFDKERKQLVETGEFFDAEGSAIVDEYCGFDDDLYYYRMSGEDEGEIRYVYGIYVSQFTPTPPPTPTQPPTSTPLGAVPPRSMTLPPMLSVIQVSSTPPSILRLPGGLSCLTNELTMTMYGGERGALVMRFKPSRGRMLATDKRIEPNESVKIDRVCRIDGRETLYYRIEGTGGNFITSDFLTTRKTR